MNKFESVCTYCVHKGVCKYEEVLAEAESDFCGVHEYPVTVRVGCEVYKAGDAGTLHR